MANTNQTRLLTKSDAACGTDRVVSPKPSSSLRAITSSDTVCHVMLRVVIHGMPKSWCESMPTFNYGDFERRIRIQLLTLEC